LVGVTYAKGLAYSLGIPLIPIHHLEGHIFAAELEHGPFPYPALILIVSGGHSTLLFSERREHYLLVAKTRDDAAGEAYDKVAKLIGLGYPGGPIIDRLAAQGDPKAYALPIARTSDGSLDLSFSGIKTAVVRLVQEHKIPIAGPSDEQQSAEIRNLAASFQYAVIATLLDRVKRAARHLSPRSIILSGGVACNRGLRETFQQHFRSAGIPVLYPRPAWTTDNAAMIAAAAIPKAMRAEYADSRLNAFAALPLTREKIALPNPLKNN
jgi:N6-L-threonylcarbamoyladenine synthase